MAETSDNALLNNLQRLLSPQPCLSLQVFDLDGNILSQTRRQLLWRLQVMFARTLANLPGISLQDIYLCGSSVTYMWREDADFDIWLKVHIDTKKFFIKNPKKARKFLNRFLSADRILHKRLFGIGNQLLDIKVCTRSTSHMHGVYSLLQNRWLIAPKMNLTAVLNPKAVYDTVIRRRRVIERRIASASLDSKEDITKLVTYYDRIVNRQYKNLFEYIVFKLLHYEKMTVKLRCCYADAIARLYSINEQKPFP